MNKGRKRFYIYLLIWVCLDFLQAVFTGIHADEAYYKLYGQFLDWGYYDHPPMVAVLTYLSGLFCTGNLSIRFFTVLLHGGTIWLVWKTIHDKTADVRAVNEFFILATSLVMFVFYGFITTPDAPLLFFTALFFFLYKKYLSDHSWLNALFLGLTMAAMLYSKYMAVLVIAFVLLSNLKLLKDIRFWGAGILALLLFAPHIMWQVSHDFPSWKYHLVLRNDAFSIQYFLEYIPNQLLVFNPICLALALYFCWKKRKTEEKFERACIFNVFGFIAFFWLMTIKGHGEPHWTVSISIPILILMYQNMRQMNWEKWIFRLILPFSILILIVRILLCTIALPENTGFSDHKTAMNALHEFCGETPIVFSSSFQQPSLYRFYTKGNAVAVSSIYNRQSQYDILQLDKTLQGKEVVLIASISEAAKINLKGIEYYYTKINHFQGTNRVQASIDNYKIIGDSVLADMTFYNSYDIPFEFNHQECPVLVFAMYAHDEWIAEPCVMLSEPEKIPPHQQLSVQAKFKLMYDTPMVISLSSIVSTPANSEVITFSKEK